MEEWESRRLEATVQAAALCAYVDGHLAPVEREILCDCVATYAESESEAQRLIGFVRDLPEWIASPASGFRASQIEEIKEGLVTREERERAFLLAAQVAHAHRGIAVDETSFLLHLMTALEVDGDFARAAIQRARRR